MREVSADLWTYSPVPESLIVRCVTTNGYIKSGGLAVMGRGTAAQAADRFPTLPRVLGAYLIKRGNVIMGPKKIYGLDRNKRMYWMNVLTFPVKHVWFDEADIKLIRQSALRLTEIAGRRPELIFLLPRPGCGNGRLDWNLVKNWISILPDNVVIVNKASRAEMDKAAIARTAMGFWEV